MQNTLLKKLSFAAVGVGIMALAASAGVSGQAPQGGGGGGRRGGGAAPAGAPAPDQGGAPAQPARAGGGGGGRGMPQGGRGPIKVLLITKGHPFERQAFFELFDALGDDITWTHIEHPAADVMIASSGTPLGFANSGESDAHSVAGVVKRAFG